jgi:apolipoprotein D and lipocalin family protein
MKHGMFVAAAFVMIISGCVSIPDRIRPVDGFEPVKYLGTWYEIARLDHSFERGMVKVSATYSLRKDGGIDVLNRGYSVSREKWEEARGKAYFVEGSDHGFLKVSFFGPFYGSYVIFDLDRQSYHYALVCGPDRSYLWILARTPEINENLKKDLIRKAADAGFDTEKLIFPDPAI